MIKNKKFKINDEVVVTSQSSDNYGCTGIVIEYEGYLVRVQLHNSNSTTSLLKYAERNLELDKCELRVGDIVEYIGDDRNYAWRLKNGLIVKFVPNMVRVKIEGSNATLEVPLSTLRKVKIAKPMAFKEGDEVRIVGTVNGSGYCGDILNINHVEKYAWVKVSLDKEVPAIMVELSNLRLIGKDEKQPHLHNPCAEVFLASDPLLKEGDEVEFISHDHILIPFGMCGTIKEVNIGECRITFSSIDDGWLVFVVKLKDIKKVNKQEQKKEIKKMNIKNFNKENLKAAKKIADRANNRQEVADAKRFYEERVDTIDANERVIKHHREEIIILEDAIKEVEKELEDFN